MIIAHHIILTSYGHWLPNDPRGSLSTELRNPQLQALGAIHLGRKKDQPSLAQIKAFYAKAQKLLQHQLLWYGDDCRRAIGEAFGSAVRSQRLTCYACGVMRNHAHLLIRRHRLKPREMIDMLKEVPRDALRNRGFAPRNHPVWSDDPYVAYKDTPDGVRAAIDYIQGNFKKHGIPPQEWDFVVSYDDWPYHKKPRVPR